MIISHIIGGLGNQMFQYATARALAERAGQSLLLDVSGFSNYYLHNGFELTRIFDGKKELATIDDERQVLGLQANPLIKRLLLRPEVSFLRAKKFVVEPHFQYWDGLFEVSECAYLTGYWQSEKYFKSIESDIRESFRFKIPMTEENNKVAGEILNSNSVSLHIRRGDYVSNAVTLSIHGVCSLDYYQAAIKYIAAHTAKPKFYIFSDDINWVKTNLVIDYPCIYVDINHGAESYNDMRLMSLCKHNIIANSSFSWWGAWLNSNANKLVVAPKRWFLNDNNTSDLYAAGWVVI